MIGEQLAMFEVETPPVRTPTRKAAESAAKPKWSPWKGRPVRCDDCAAILAEAKGEGPASRPARWRRVQGKVDLLLCYAHGRIRRVEDGLEESAE